MLVFFYRNCLTVLVKRFTGGDQNENYYNLTDSQWGAFGSMYFYPYAIMQVFGGLLSDLFPPHVILCIFTLVSAAGTFICGYTSNFSLLCFGRALVGIGTGPVFVPASKLQGSWIPPKWYPVSNGLLLAIGSAGGLIASTPLQEFVEFLENKNPKNWYLIFPIFGGIGIAIGLGSLVFVKNTPESIGYNKYGETIPEYNPDDGEKQSFLEVLKFKFIQLMKNFVIVVRNPKFWPPAIWDILNPSTYFFYTSTLSNNYQRAIGKEDSDSSRNNLLYSFAWVFGAPIMSFVSDTVHSRKYVLVVGSAVASICSALFLALSSSALTNAVVSTLYFLWALGNSATIGVCLAMYKEQQPLSLQASAMGVGNSLPQITCAILQNLTPVYLKAAAKAEGITDSSEYTQKVYNLGFWLPTLIMNFLGGVVVLFATETYGLHNENHTKNEELEKKTESIDSVAERAQI